MCTCCTNNVLELKFPLLTTSEKGCFDISHVYIRYILCICALYPSIHRINFTLEDLAPAAPSYKYFQQCLVKPYPYSGGIMRFSAKQLPTDFPQSVHYERVEELVSKGKGGLVIYTLRAKP